jgi:hypothetical protein
LLAPLCQIISFYSCLDKFADNFPFVPIACVWVNGICTPGEYSGSAGSYSNFMVSASGFLVLHSD